MGDGVGSAPKRAGARPGGGAGEDAASAMKRREMEECLAIGRNAAKSGYEIVLLEQGGDTGQVSKRSWQLEASATELGAGAEDRVHPDEVVAYLDESLAGERLLSISGKPEENVEHDAETLGLGQVAHAVTGEVKKSSKLKAAGHAIAASGRGAASAEGANVALGEGGNEKGARGTDGCVLQ